MLQRVRELLVQGSNDTNTQDQRSMIEQEISQLATEIASMQQRVEFNTNRVLSMGPALDIEISKNIAKIDSNNLILNAITNSLNTNRAAVSDAREMLALFNSTDTWESLQENTRLATVLREALGAVSMQVSALGLPDNIVSIGWQTNIAGQTITDVAGIAGAGAEVAAVCGTIGAAQSRSSLNNDGAAILTTVSDGDGNDTVVFLGMSGQTSGSVSYRTGIVAGTPGTAAVATAQFNMVSMSNNMTVTDLIGLLNTRDTNIMNSLGEVSSIRTEMRT